MRGKGKSFRRDNRLFGITPAYAGKSKRDPYSFRFSWDHPRLCGEKLLGDCEPAADRGSPPPMRGKGSKRIFSHLPSRITPAYAGKSRKEYR